MKLNNRFIFGILSLVLAAVIAFVALPTIARQTNGKTEIVRITQPVLKGEKITSDNAEVVEVGGYNLPSNVAHSMEDVEGLCVTADLAAGDYILTSKVSTVRPGRRRLYPHQQGQYRPCFLGCGAQRYPLRQGRHLTERKNAGLRPVG